MVKGEDAIRRKKNKALRKRNNRKETVSARVAAIIASKKRRLTGKRRVCEGMCFSLPTPDDPFNERKNAKKDLKGKKDFKKAADLSLTDSKESIKRKPYEKHDSNGNELPQLKSVLNKVLKSAQEKNEAKIHVATKKMKLGSQISEVELHAYESKFLVSCLNSIEEAFRVSGVSSTEVVKPFVSNAWGIEFLEIYLAGKDILETSGTCPGIEQIAWMVSVAADSISKKENKGLSLSGPFLLYLVPTQEKASKIRSVCKPLKALGIHTVSLHPGASINHQIHGLKSCDPEFLVSTPERLLQLVSLKAIDLSGVSLFVIDGLDTVYGDVMLETAKTVVDCISGDHITVVCSDHFNYLASPAAKSLLKKAVRRLSLHDSITSQSACISQSVHLCPSEEEKILKGIRILDEACGNNHISPQSRIVLVVGEKSRELFTALRSGGYFVSKVSRIPSTELEKGEWKAGVCVTDMDHIRKVDLGNYELVVVLDISSSVEDYVHILRQMARDTVEGQVHSLITEESSAMARPLVEILGQCGQPIPEFLKELCVVPPASEQ